MYEYDSKLNDDDEGLDSITDVYLFLLGFFTFTFLIALLFLVLSDDYQNVMLGLVFF